MVRPDEERAAFNLQRCSVRHLSQCSHMPDHENFLLVALFLFRSSAQNSR
jgi:hypothetical protein